MTIASSTNKTSPFAGNDTTGPWAFTFKTLDEADLEVIKLVSGVESVLVLNTDYTVSLNGDQEASPGGDITTTANVATGETLVIRRVVEALQGVDLVQGGAFNPSVIETALDRLTMLAQQLGEEVDRSVKVDLTSGDDPATLIASVIAAETAATASADAAAASEAAAAASETAAGISETNAAASAVTAQAAADSVMWNDVVFKTSADSPITITDADTGKLFALDCTSGAITVNLPAISGLTLSTPWSVGFRKQDATANAVTINRNGTDTIDGAASTTITTQNIGKVLVPDTDPSPDVWTSMSFGAELADGSVTTAKLANSAFSGLTGVSAATDDEVPIADTSDSGNKKKVTIASLLALGAAFPTGTKMLFQQTAAPTGWTKDTTHNDKALRVVSGTASDGGTSAFSTVFGKTATDTHTLTTAQMPSHSHSLSAGADGNFTSITTTSRFAVYDSNAESLHTINAQSVANTNSIVSAGSGSSHSHNIDIRVQYVDLIIASKD